MTKPRVIRSVAFGLGMSGIIMRQFTCTIGLSVAIACLTGCDHTRSQSAWTKVDSWYHALPTDEGSALNTLMRFHEAEPLVESSSVEVAAGHLREAEEMLDDAACAELTPELAAELTGRPMQPQLGSELFLVRAVYLIRETGHFRVYHAQDELWVTHGCMGSSPVPMKRQPLVVRLPRKPERVYVTCSMMK